MKKSLGLLVAVAVACVPIPAFAADLSADESSNLRARADGLIAERQRNPGWDGGTTRLSQTRGDVDLSQNRGEVKTPQRGEVNTKVKGGKKPKSKSASKKAKRSVKDVPGALVRSP